MAVLTALLGLALPLPPGICHPFSVPPAPPRSRWARRAGCQHVRPLLRLARTGGAGRHCTEPSPPDSGTPNSFSDKLLHGRIFSPAPGLLPKHRDTVPGSCPSPQTAGDRRWVKKKVCRMNNRANPSSLSVTLGVVVRLRGSYGTPGAPCRPGACQLSPAPTVPEGPCTCPPSRKNTLSVLSSHTSGLHPSVPSESVHRILRQAAPDPHRSFLMSYLEPT